MKTKKIIYIDTETTGLDPKIHGMREIGFIIEIDGEVKEKDVFYIDPTTYNKKIEIDPIALEISGKILEDFKSTNYQNSRWVFDKFITILDKYIDKFDKNDKFKINGYNTQFDIGFIKAWFKDNDHGYYGAYFDYKSLDVFALVGFLRLKGFIDSENDKLKTICDYFKIELKAHNALDDIIATKELNDELIKYLYDIRGFDEIEHALSEEVFLLKRENKQLQENREFSKLEEFCISRDYNISVTWQRMTDWSIEIYTGYKTKYSKLFYTDGHIDKSEALNKAFEHFEIKDK